MTAFTPAPALVVRVVLIALVAVMAVFAPFSVAMAHDADPRATASFVGVPSDGDAVSLAAVDPDAALTVRLPRVIYPDAHPIRATSVVSGTTAPDLNSIGTSILTALRNAFAVAAAIGMMGYFITVVLQGFFGDAVSGTKTGFMKLLLACIGAGLVTQLVNWAVAIGGPSNIKGLSSAPTLIVLAWWMWQHRHSPPSVVVERMLIQPQDGHPQEDGQDTDR